MQPQYITLPKLAKDVTGQRFGRLVALGPVGKDHKKNMVWLCQCDCGRTYTCATVNLIGGNTQSCGCIQRDILVARNQTHGLSRDPLYKTWASTVKRCVNPKCRHYANYGGRGIQIFDEWRNSFKAFHDHVTQLPHYGEKGYSLDRIDNDGNYEPGNVRWATQTQQARNKRNNQVLTYKGKTQSLVAWSEELQINRATLRNRIKRGWSVTDALTIPEWGRRADRPVLIGEQSHGSKLTAPEVIEIRSQHAQGAKQIHLAKEYRVCVNTIAKIVNRKTWAHLP